MIKAPLLHVSDAVQQRLTLGGMFAHSVGVIPDETVRFLLQNENRPDIPHLVLLATQLGRDQRIFLENATESLTVQMPIPSELAKEWETFWRDEYAVKADFAGLLIPSPPIGYKARFGLMHKKYSQSPEALFQADKKAYGGKVWKFTKRNLDEVVTVHKKTGTFGFWVADEQEAHDGCVGGINLNTLAVDELGWSTETLTMRQVHGRKFFRERGEHLDIKKVTVAAGSRCADGDVPGVDRSDDGDVDVNYWLPSDADDCLRFRRAIL